LSRGGYGLFRRPWTCQRTKATRTRARPGSLCPDNAACQPLVSRYLVSFCRALLTFARTIHADHIAVAYRIIRHRYGTSHEPSRGVDGSQPLAVGFQERLGGNTLRWLQQAGDGQACQRTLAMGTA